MPRFKTPYEPCYGLRAVLHFLDPTYFSPTGLPSWGATQYLWIQCYTYIFQLPHRISLFVVTPRIGIASPLFFFLHFFILPCTMYWPWAPWAHSVVDGMEQDTSAAIGGRIFWAKEKSDWWGSSTIKTEEIPNHCIVGIQSVFVPPLFFDKYLSHDIFRRVVLSVFSTSDFLGGVLLYY